MTDSEADRLSDHGDSLRGGHHESYNLIVNKQDKPWSEEFITGRQIKSLAGSAAEWVVNQIVPGPGGDPEISDDQRVDLAKKASPEGVKKFITRKPSTTPGA
jgi:hypothetical protein